MIMIHNDRSTPSIGGSEIFVSEHMPTYLRPFPCQKNGNDLQIGKTFLSISMYVTFSYVDIACTYICSSCCSVTFILLLKKLL